MASLLVLSVLVWSTYGTLNKQLFDSDTVGGKCLDGSPAGYYYEPPPKGSDGSFWVIYLEGGGMCDSEISCKERAETLWGSSNDWPPFITGEASFSSSKSENPYFYDGHHVFVPYCAGDAHTGQVTTPTKSTWGFYFDGHYIVENVIQDLIDKYQLDEAKNLLLTGCSAGALGTFANIDFVADKLPNVSVKGIPVAGWFFAGNTTDQPNDLWAPPNDYPHYESGTQGGIAHDNSTSVLWNSYLHPSCLKTESVAWHCQSVHVVYQYIQTPLFVLENQFDAQQISTEMKMPNEKNDKTRGYVKYFGGDMIRSLSQIGVTGPNKDNGLFFPSCFDHCTGIGIGSGGTTHIGEYNSTLLSGDWYWGYNKYPHIVMDTCTANTTDGLPCNPSCEGF